MNSITFMIGQLVLGGAEKQLYLLITGLIARGWKVKVITLHGGNCDYWEQPIRDLGVEVFEVNTSSRFDAIRKMVTFVKKNPTEILHSWSSFTGVYALLVATLTRTPLCVGSQRSSEKYTIRDLGFILYWLSYCGIKGITVNSRFGMMELKRRWPKKEICYIPNGIDTSKLSENSAVVNQKILREEFNIPSDMFIVGAVGLMAYVKRFDLLIDSVKIIQNNGYQCGLVIIGDGPLYSQIYDRASSILRCGSFFFPGSVNNADKYMPMFDAYCLTSDYEGTPNVIMEALASGIPVIATNVGDVGEIIENGVSGMVLPSNEPAVVSEYIRVLIEEPKLRKEISKNGKESISGKFNTDVMLDRMIEFYRQMESYKIKRKKEFEPTTGR